MWLRRFLANHVTANLTFGLVLVVGTMAYLQMPRAKDPEVNFNWINMTTFLPGASAEDVEKRITDPLEDALRTSVSDIRFVVSSSREGTSNILVRFQQIDERTFDRRVVDLRREVQNTYNDELPEEAESPIILEITTANAFPSASVIVTGPGDDENLRTQARNVEKELEQLQGVDRVINLGLSDPEIHVEFIPERLTGLGISPADLADTVDVYFRDVSAGDVLVNGREWLVRIVGTDEDPGSLAKMPVTVAQGVVNLGSLAKIYRTTEKPSDLVRYRGQPAVMLSVMKQGKTNVLELVERVNDYIDYKNRFSSVTGARLVLFDDQTASTRKAIKIMQVNAALGLGFVLFVTWLFLGSRIAALTSIGIPFTLAGTFLILHASGTTLNNSVLLGVVIALGMIVDDAVVVVETIYQRLQHGAVALEAAVGALREVFAPVTTSVLTTMAAFLPLMLLPGIMGDFMKVIPMVVSLALAISLVEAYWMLPAHIIAAKVNFERPTSLERIRRRATHWLRVKYAKALIKVFRRPVLSLCTVVLLFVLSLTAVFTDVIRTQFFAFDPYRLFYINITMPPGTPLETTIGATEEVERRARVHLIPEEVRSLVSYSGQMFTEIEPLFGSHYGQIMVSLKPKLGNIRGVDEILAAIQPALEGVVGPTNVAILRVSDGPPAAKPISIKVRGDEFVEIERATQKLLEILAVTPGISGVTVDSTVGSQELSLRYDGEAIQRAGVHPSTLARTIRLLSDGEIVADFQHHGEKVEVRVVAREDRRQNIESLLRQTISLPDGNAVPIGELVRHETREGAYNVRHYNFRRSVTVEADLDKKVMDTVAANEAVIEAWEKISTRFPNVDLDFSGELDDIQESLDAIGFLFLFGVGLIYLILGTQFRSYWQPLMILATIPMAFIGVAIGLFITGNPISLYTLYGMVALAGIAVNAAIVLISAANSRLASGMSVLHAILYAARRRVTPVIITALTTIAGLFSLATGLAGRSLIWGPVATTIVWGLAFSTVLTLFMIPLLYRLVMTRSGLNHKRAI